MNERWLKLFEKALDIIEKAGITSDEWSFGGGSALTVYYHHRESFDVDIFLNDAQHLLLLTPRLNSYIEGIEDYNEMSNFVKIKMSDGEIDFILAPHLTQDWYIKKEIFNRVIMMETPWEIVIKKLFYRPESLKIRDILDTAVVLKNEEGKMLEYSSIIFPKIKVIESRWKKIKGIYVKEAKQLIILDKTLVESAAAIFEGYLKNIRKRM